MKLLVLADPHLDLYFAGGVDPFKDVPAEQLGCITHCVLAGDVSNKGHKKWKECLRWITARLPEAQVFVMPGNHDYYDGCIDQEDKLRDVAAVYGAAFIQKSELVFGRHRILCCTLWTDFEIYGDRTDNLRHAATYMNDYNFIRVARKGYKKLVPVETAQIHLDHRRWLEEQLSTSFDGETTVITHHAPHVMALKDTPGIGPCYASNLEAMIIKYKPERWLYGHTHHRVTFSIDQTLLTNVSVGYPGQHDPIDDLARFTFDLDGGDAP
jgi:predicted phosphodiesterase